MTLTIGTEATDRLLDEAAPVPQDETMDPDDDGRRPSWWQSQTGDQAAQYAEMARAMKAGRGGS